MKSKKAKIKGGRGRPKFRFYDAGITIRMTKRDLKELQFKFDQFITAKGLWDKRGNRRSFNEFLLERLKHGK